MSDATSPSLETLAEALRDASWWTRMQAVVEVARLPDHARTDALLLDVLHGDPHPEVAAVAAHELGLRRHSPAVPALVIAAARDENPDDSELTDEASGALTALREDVVAQARAWARDADPTRRRAALNAMAEVIRSDDAWAVEASAVGLTDLVPGVRTKAALLASVAAHHEVSGANELVDAVIDRLTSDPDQAVRREAARALGYLGGSAAAAALDTASSDPAESVRSSAASARERLRHESER